jgi:hypothetical protein
VQEVQLTCTCDLPDPAPLCNLEAARTADKERMDALKFSAEEVLLQIRDLSIFFFPGGGGAVAEHAQMQIRRMSKREMKEARRDETRRDKLESPLNFQCGADHGVIR